jgi:hypothetical protein
MKVFIEVYIDNQSVFVIIYLSHCLGGLTQREKNGKHEILKLTIQNEKESLLVLQTLHLRIGSTVMLKMVGG